MISKNMNRVFSVFLTTALCMMGTTVNVFAGTISGTPEQKAQEIVSKMTTEEKIGQMLMLDFRTWNGKNLTAMNDEVAGVIKNYHLGGVILFAENIQGTEQTVRLTDDMQKAVDKIPLLITTDQEGGVVARINGGTCMPGNMALGAANDKDLTYRVAKAIGEEVNVLGINVNFSPDMDVNCNPDNPVIGVRSFAGDPDIVSNMGQAYIKGITDAGVIATVKHFPGHGNVATDSHIGLPVVNGDINEMNAVELKPFKAAVEGGVDMVMTAHIQVPALDSTTAVSIKDNVSIILPATMSQKILTGELRNTLGFKGVIVTDALNMGAIADNFEKLDAIERCITAGADIPLMPVTIHQSSDINTFNTIFGKLVADANSGVLSMNRINESAQRIIALKIKRKIYDPTGVSIDNKTIEQKIAGANAAVGSDAHRAIEKEAANKAVTLVKNDDTVLPFKMEDGQKILCIAPWDTRLTAFIKETQNIANAKGFKNIQVDGIDYSTTWAIDEATKAKIDKADYVLLGTYSYDSSSRQANSKYVIYANSIIDYAKNAEKPLAIMGIRNPYEIDQMPNAKDFIAVYGKDGINGSMSWQNIQAGIRAIFGEVNPTGKLPVAIPTADNTGVLYEVGHGLSYSNAPIPNSMVTLLKVIVNFFR